MIKLVYNLPMEVHIKGKPKEYKVNKIAEIQALINKFKKQNYIIKKGIKVDIYV